MDLYRMQSLLAPFHSRSLHLMNRVMMAPMTRCMSGNGVPGADVAAYYRRRAEHDVDVIITEASYVPHPADPDWIHRMKTGGVTALSPFSSSLLNVLY